MSTDTQRVRSADPTGAGRIDNSDLVAASTVAYPVRQPNVDVDVTEVEFRDRIRWGPIIAGVVTGFAVLLFLTIIGAALGLSALGGDNDTSGWATTAGIYGAITLLLAFFAGGYMAARSAAPTPESNGLLNGFMVGVTSLLLLLWMATTAVTGALGFFAGTITDIAGTAVPAVTEAVDQGAVEQVQEAVPAVGEAVDDAEAVVDDAAADPNAAVTGVTEQIEEALPADPGAAAADVASENIAPVAWGTAIAMLLAVGAAALGGRFGSGQRRTGTVVT